MEDIVIKQVLMTAGEVENILFNDVVSPENNDKMVTMFNGLFTLTPQYSPNLQWKDDNNITGEIPQVSTDLLSVTVDEAIQTDKATYLISLMVTNTSGSQPKFLNIELYIDGTVEVYKQFTIEKGAKNKTLIFNGTFVRDHAAGLAYVIKYSSTDNDLTIDGSTSKANLIIEKQITTVATRNLVKILNGNTPNDPVEGLNINWNTIREVNYNTSNTPTKAQFIEAFKLLPLYRDIPEVWGEDKDFYVKDTNSNRLFLVRYRNKGATSEATAGDFYFERMTKAS